MDLVTFLLAKTRETVHEESLEACSIIKIVVD